jgi:ribosomal protein S18 acetylase RimI-like enzyme
VSATLRPAHPDDAPLLSWVILAAGRSHVATSFWDLLLDRPSDGTICAYLDRLVLAPRRSWWHHETFLVAEAGGEPAAALSGFAPDDPGMEAPALSVSGALAAQGVARADAEAGFARAAPFLACTLEPAPGAWVVENVAARPAHRGRGLGDALVEEVLARGRARGHRLAQLTLFIGNERAQRLYERHGFRIAVERRHPAFEAAIGCPGLARMQRVL